MVFHTLSNLFRGTRGMQYVSVIIASLGVTNALMYLSWPSPTLAKLKSEDSPIGRPITDEEASWIISIVTIVGLPAAITYHWTAARFGRKETLRAASVVMFLPWIIIIFGNHIAYLWVARVLAGVLIGITFVTTAMYCAEIADADIRGRLGTFYGIMALVGSVLVFAAGPFVSYKMLAIICAVVSFSIIVLLFFIPESPYWLVKKNRLKDARDAVIMLSGSSDGQEVDKRIRTITDFVRTEEKPLSVKEVFSNRKYVGAIAIVCSIEALYNLCGYTAILNYQQEIIARSKSGISPEISSIVFGLIQIPAVLLSAYIVDRVGRKVILYIGTTGSLISMLAEGTYFFLEEYLKMDLSGISWLPTTGLVIFLVSQALHGSVSYILLGEFFTDKIKSVGTMVFLCSGAVSGFVVTKTFDPMRQAWGVYTCFWAYAGFTIVLALVTYFFLIETRNKTFAEIENKVYK